MAIVVVGGSAKDVGKTALVCGVISALPEFGWTAVKISGHDYEPDGAEKKRPETWTPTVWEETHAGQETDTARYLAAGARRALLVTRVGAETPIDQIRNAIGEDRNIIFESNRIVDAVTPDVCLALVGDRAERKPSFLPVLRVADAVVSVGNAQAQDPDVQAGIQRFELESLEPISGELKNWLRVRLNRD